MSISWQDISVKKSMIISNPLYLNICRNTGCDVMCIVNTTNESEDIKSSSIIKSKQYRAKMPYKKIMTLRTSTKNITPTLYQRHLLNESNNNFNDNLINERNSYFSILYNELNNKMILHNKAATKIQALYRGYRIRLPTIKYKYQRKLKSINKLILFELQEELCLYSSVIGLKPIPGLNLESIHKTSKRRKRIENAAAYRIQKFFKMILSRKFALLMINQMRMNKYNKASHKIARFFKFVKKRHTVARIQALQKYTAVITLQSYCRGLASRIRFYKLKKEMLLQRRTNDAAIILQRSYRKTKIMDFHKPKLYVDMKINETIDHFIDNYIVNDVIDNFIILFKIENKLKLAYKNTIDILYNELLLNRINKLSHEIYNSEYEFVMENLSRRVLDKVTNDVCDQMITTLSHGYDQAIELTKSNKIEELIDKAILKSTNNTVSFLYNKVTSNVPKIIYSNSINRSTINQCINNTANFTLTNAVDDIANLLYKKQLTNHLTTESLNVVNNQVADELIESSITTLSTNIIKKSKVLIDTSIYSDRIVNLLIDLVVNGLTDQLINQKQDFINNQVDSNSINIYETMSKTIVNDIILKSIDKYNESCNPNLSINDITFLIHNISTDLIENIITTSKDHILDPTIKQITNNTKSKSNDTSSYSSICHDMSKAMLERIINDIISNISHQSDNSVSDSIKEIAKNTIVICIDKAIAMTQLVIPVNNTAMYPIIASINNNIYLGLYIQAKEQLDQLTTNQLSIYLQIIIKYLTGLLHYKVVRYSNSISCYKQGIAMIETLDKSIESYNQCRKLLQVMFYEKMGLCYKDMAYYDDSKQCYVLASKSMNSLTNQIEITYEISLNKDLSFVLASLAPSIYTINLSILTGIGTIEYTRGLYNLLHITVTRINKYLTIIPLNLVDQLVIIDYLLLLSNIYILMCNYKKSLLIYDNILDRLDNNADICHIPNHSLYINVYNRIINVYLLLHKYNYTYQYLNKSYKLVVNKYTNFLTNYSNIQYNYISYYINNELSDSYYYIGRFNYEIGHLNIAYNYYMKSLSIKQVYLSNHPSIADLYYFISLYYLSIGNISLVEQNIDFYYKIYLSISSHKLDYNMLLYQLLKIYILEYKGLYLQSLRQCQQVISLFNQFMKLFVNLFLNSKSNELPYDDSAESVNSSIYSPRNNLYESSVSIAGSSYTSVSYANDVHTSKYSSQSNMIDSSNPDQSIESIVIEHSSSSKSTYDNSNSYQNKSIDNSVYSTSDSLRDRERSLQSSVSRTIDESNDRIYSRTSDPSHSNNESKDNLNEQSLERSTYSDNSLDYDRRDSLISAYSSNVNASVDADNHSSKSNLVEGSRESNALNDSVDGNVSKSNATSSKEISLERDRRGSLESSVYSSNTNLIEDSKIIEGSIDGSTDFDNDRKVSIVSNYSSNYKDGNSIDKAKSTDNIRRDSLESSTYSSNTNLIEGSVESNNNLERSLDGSVERSIYSSRTYDRNNIVDLHSSVSYEEGSVESSTKSRFKGGSIETNSTRTTYRRDSIDIQSSIGIDGSIDNSSYSPKSNLTDDSSAVIERLPLKYLLSNTNSQTNSNANSYTNSYANSYANSQTNSEIFSHRNSLIDNTLHSQIYDYLNDNSTNSNISITSTQSFMSILDDAFDNLLDNKTISTHRKSIHSQLDDVISIETTINTCLFVNIDIYKIKLANLYVKLCQDSEIVRDILSLSSQRISNVYGESSIYIVNSLFVLGELSYLHGKFSDTKIVFERCVSILLEIYSPIYLSMYSIDDYSLLDHSIDNIYKSNDNIDSYINNLLNLDLTSYTSNINNEYNNYIDKQYDHPLLSNCYSYLSENFRYIGYYQLSAQLCDQSTNISNRLFITSSSYMGICLYYRALIINDIGLHENAFDLYNKSLDIIRNEIGSDNGLYGMILSDYCLCLLHLSIIQNQLYVNYIDIYNKLIKCIELISNNYHPTHYLVGVAYSTLAYLEYVNKCVEKSIDLLINKSIPILISNLGINHPYTLYIKACLSIYQNNNTHDIYYALFQYKMNEPFTFPESHPWVIRLGGYDLLDKQINDRIDNDLQVGSSLELGSVNDDSTNISNNTEIINDQIDYNEEDNKEDT